jgi:hypothetical protein
MERVSTARLPESTHTSRPWRIHELTRARALWAIRWKLGEWLGWDEEIANKTVHGVMHMGWVPDGTGGYRGQMAVLVKPNGRLGGAYMAAIRPFRHLIVYPPMLRHIEREWRART